MSNNIRQAYTNANSD